MIDWEQVEELRNAVGGDEFGELVEVFLDEVEGVLESLTQDTVAEADALQSKLHFLKGSALNLGFADFASQCQSGETMAKNGNVADISIGKIQYSYHLTKDVFLAEILERYAA